MIDNDNNEHDLNLKMEHANKPQDQELLKSVFDQDKNLELKDNEIAILKNKLNEIQNHEKDTVLRLKAEIENIRRRNAQEIEKTHKFALERFVAELLPVIDNLERTLNIIDRSNTILLAIVEGIDLTLKSFLDTVYKFGVESVHKVHVPFNPDVHQAISTIDSTEHKSNTVLSIIQKGYLLNGRLIRPAMVTVSKFTQIDL